MAGVHGGAGIVTPRVNPCVASRSTPAELIRRCRGGDEGAWVELVGRYERLVFGVARREGLGLDDAADVCQAVFEALITALPDLREDEKLSAWLHAVARRQAWRVRERRNCEPAMGTASEDSIHLPMAANGSADPAANIDRALSLHEALQELGEPCRSLLVALCFDPTNPSDDEVAMRLGRPVGSIGPSRARCLQQLRAAMQGGEW